MDVEAFAGMRKDSHQIAQIRRLMPVKEVLLQVERFEDKVCMFLIEPVLAEEWVVAYGNVWPGGIQDAQLVHSSRRLNGG